MLEKFGGTRYTQMVAATQSYVCMQCPPDADCGWFKLPIVPGGPRCLAHYQGTMLWAATDSGVFRYDHPTAVGGNNISASVTSITVKVRPGEKGNVFVHITNGDGRACEFSLFDMQGKCVKIRSIMGSHSVVPVTTKGIYLFKVAMDKITVRTGRVIRY